MSATEDYLENNRRHAETTRGGERLVPPSKKIAIVACMDARVDTTALLGIADGEAHVIRNAGGVITEDVIRSLAISQQVLGTREIMLIHHTDCGMLKMKEEDLKDLIEVQTGTRPGFTMRAFSDLDADVRKGIAQLEAEPLVSHADAIRGFVYEVENGRLREVR